MERMKPLRHTVLLRVDPKETKTKTGISINAAGAWNKLPPTGTVLAVGPQVKDVRPGDRVVFARYAVIELDERQTELRLILDKNIMGVIDGETS